MAKKGNSYLCNNCGEVYATWSGKCNNCGEWNSLAEFHEAKLSSGKRSAEKLAPIAVANAGDNRQERIKTGVDALDVVFGGGIVAASVTLLAGQPGIGKSTILLQIAASVAKKHPVLYVSAEESVEQVGLRAQRLAVEASNLMLVSSTSSDDIANEIHTKKYKLVIVDSIQTVQCRDVASASGTISQITNSTSMLIEAAKKSGTAVLLVGHVTKEGNIAGPKLLEHVVDVVLQLEGDRFGGYKVLRAAKNRYGATDETAILEMKDGGITVVDNPSQVMLAERHITDGSVVLVSMEGTRPILVEVQALVNTSSYGYPKRTASGFDLNRLNVLIAVLEKRTKLNLADKDVFVNIVGGFKLQDPAADLAVCMAVGSAAKGLLLKKNLAVFGEVGLSGEVRHAQFGSRRVQEAVKLGYDVIGPKSREKIKGLNSVEDVKTALNSYLETK